MQIDRENQLIPYPLMHTILCVASVAQAIHVPSLWYKYKESRGGSNKKSIKIRVVVMNVIL